MSALNDLYEAAAAKAEEDNSVRQPDPVIRKNFDSQLETLQLEPILSDLEKEKFLISRDDVFDGDRQGLTIRISKDCNKLGAHLFFVIRLQDNSVEFNSSDSREFQTFSLEDVKEAVGKWYFKNKPISERIDAKLDEPAKKPGIRGLVSTATFGLL